MTAIDDPVAAFYDGLGAGEWERHDAPFSRIEYLSTVRLIDQYFPASGQALDIGGGPGRYTIELIRRCFHVTLLDLSPGLVALAGQHLAELKMSADGLQVGDARELSRFPDHAFDVLLLMGPLYHLSERTDRLRALREARRVLKPGGRALIAYLNSWGLIRTGLTDFPAKYADPAFVRGLFHQGGLGIWYWSNPDLARAELAEVGFEVVAYGGMEGFASGMMSTINRLAAEDPVAYTEVVKAAVESSGLPQFRDATDHLHFIVA